MGSGWEGVETGWEVTGWEAWVAVGSEAQGEVEPVVVA